MMPKDVSETRAHARPAGTETTAGTENDFSVEILRNRNMRETDGRTDEH